MLSYPHPLYFPKIINTGRSTQQGTSNKFYSIYTLEWEQKENTCRKKHEEWNLEHWKNQPIPFIPSLPQDIDIWITNMKFVIPSVYRKEINRNARRCIQEWNVNRPFDTNVREYCLKTAETHAFIAFYLLEDCAWDISNNCYYRKEHDDRFLVKHTLAYKFWAHQIGRGCVRENARLDELEKIRDYDFMVGDKDMRKRGELAEEFLENIETHEKEMEKMTPNIEDEEGKSL